MYESYFGLKENPFNLTPDTRYLFLSSQHREAMNHLMYGITERKGFIVISGGIGTGKTTICRTLLSLLDDSVRVALIFNSFISDIELLRTIREEFGITFSRGRKTKKHHIDALNAFLLKNFAAGRNAVLVIDEAQNLSLSVLEQIRMLSNLETEKEKLLQIVLVGQPELRDILRSPSLRQLNERITVRYEIETLSRRQVRQYIQHRIAVAEGNNGTLRFTPMASFWVHGCSRGNPRRINAICDRALLIAYARGIKKVHAGIVRKAVSDIGGGYGGFFTLGQSARGQRHVAAGMIAVAALLALIGAFFYDSVTKTIMSITALLM